MPGSNLSTSGGCTVYSKWLLFRRAQLQLSVCVATNSGSSTLLWVCTGDECGGEEEWRQSGVAGVAVEVLSSTPPRPGLWDWCLQGTYTINIVMSGQHKKLHHCVNVHEFVQSNGYSRRKLRMKIFNKYCKPMYAQNLEGRWLSSVLIATFLFVQVNEIRLSIMKQNNPR